MQLQAQLEAYNQIQMSYSHTTRIQSEVLTIFDKANKSCAVHVLCQQQER